MKNIPPPVIPNAVRDLTNSPSHGARKNRSSKTILVFFALGLISCAFCVQQAQAVPINGGVITIAGGAELDNADVNMATRSRGWLDPTVQGVSGGFASFVNAGDTVTMLPGLLVPAKLRFGALVGSRLT